MHRQWNPLELRSATRCGTGTIDNRVPKCADLVDHVLGDTEPGDDTAYPRSMFAKLIVVVIVVAVLFWLLTKFRDSNRGGR